MIKILTNYFYITQLLRYTYIQLLHNRQCRFDIYNVYLDSQGTQTYIEQSVRDTALSHAL